MSPRAALTRRTASAIRSEPCVFCVAHQLRRPVHHNALRQIDSRPRTSSSGRSLTCFSESIRSAHHRPGPQLVKKPRGKPLTLEEYESTNRIGVYTMFQQGGNLSIKPEVANQIVKEFMAPKSDPVARVKQLAEGWCHVNFPKVSPFTYNTLQGTRPSYQN